MHIKFSPVEEYDSPVLILTRQDNKFLRDGQQFGWETIEGMLACEVQRLKHLISERKPCVKRSLDKTECEACHNHVGMVCNIIHMYKYAVDQQQEHMLAELHEYVSQTPPHQIPNPFYKLWPT